MGKEIYICKEIQFNKALLDTLKEHISKNNYAIEKLERLLEHANRNNFVTVGGIAEGHIKALASVNQIYETIITLIEENSENLKTASLDEAMLCADTLYL